MKKAISGKSIFTELLHAPSLFWQGQIQGGVADGHVPPYVQILV